MADLGQFFTKGIVAQYMVSLFDLPKYATIMDPCYGAGSFLKALASDGFTNVTACEIDATLFNETKNRYPEFRLLNADFLQFDGIFDGIIMNPPYIRQEKIDELAEYGITKERLRSNPVFDGLPSTANMYMYRKPCMPYRSEHRSLNRTLFYLHRMDGLSTIHYGNGRSKTSSACCRSIRAVFRIAYSAARHPI